MAAQNKTTAVNFRINTQLKEDAERIMHMLGIAPSAAVQMLYAQIVQRRALPFTPALAMRAPLDESKLTREELDAVLQEAWEEAEAGITYSAAEVEHMMHEEFGL